MVSIHYVFFFVVFLLNKNPINAKVLELSDRFLTFKNDGMWLIMFYAPWCGHCKKLEPIWKHVSQSLSTYFPGEIKIGRLDCTRFPSVSREFSITVYPTIIFLKGDAHFVYDGDRTRQEIVAFAFRLMGPPVRPIYTSTEFRGILKEQSGNVIFVYIGLSDDNSVIWTIYDSLASNFYQLESFYICSGVISSNITGISSEEEVVRVFKDGVSSLFTPPHPILIDPGFDSIQQAQYNADVINASLYRWILNERFPRFMKITFSKFAQLTLTDKYIVMAVLEENKLGELNDSTMMSFREMLKTVAFKDNLTTAFQFGWTGSPSLGNSVAMMTLPLPFLLIINSSTLQYFIPDDDPIQLTPEAVELYLEGVIRGEMPSYGGKSYTVQLYRAYYQTRSSVVQMWKGNPTLMTLLFGLPLGFLSLILYSICCADIMDAEDDDDEDDNYTGDGLMHHEKVE